jgi:hypothetical protein
VIRINKPYGYLIGLGLTLLIYFISQLAFFINTSTVKGYICDITTTRKRIEIYYACFDAGANEVIKFRAGSNLDYGYEEKVAVIYKKNNPHNARINSFTELWIFPGLYSFFIPFVLIMAGITGLFYGRTFIIINKKPFRISAISDKRM